ncbi:unnamed protein product, partial [Rotaria sp. Silwood2]
MCLSLFTLFYFFIFTAAKHFNGGSIGWAPVDPYDNSTSVNITITQTYSWTYPYIKCLNNVPSSTNGWSGANTNLTCVVDCSTDGGYSNAPIDILTDCTSASASMKMMTSERSKSVTLSADAHFYIAYRGSAWVALNDPSQQGLDWSIVTYIDLRKRPDGFINTPPVAKVVSPQYAIVNKTIQINIPVSDANAGDDVRCRWSTYTTGYRRRKRFDKEEHIKHRSDVRFYEEVAKDREMIYIRKKRGSCGSCSHSCPNGCDCSCPGCGSGSCTGSTCTDSGGCDATTTTIGTTTTVAATTTGATTTTHVTTTTVAATTTAATTTTVAATTTGATTTTHVTTTTVAATTTAATTTTVAATTTGATT